MPIVYRNFSIVRAAANRFEVYSDVLLAVRRTLKEAETFVDLCLDHSTIYIPLPTLMTILGAESKGANL